MNKTTWKSAAGYVIGRSHEKEQKPCQDRTLVEKRGALSFAAVSDGAGSASHSHYGAETILEAVASLLFDKFEQYALLDEQIIKQELIQCITSALEKLTIKYEAPLHAFASTLLFVISDEETYISGHIGDGLIVQLDDGLHIHSYPENGAYANVTYFTTSADVHERLRIKKGLLENIEGFFLMSDGTTSAMYRKQDDYIAPALLTIASWLKEHEEAMVNEAIEQNLQKAIRQKTFDDCALAVMVKHSE